MSHEADSDGMLPPRLTINGDLSASQDITILGRFVGRITLPDHHLSIEASASVQAKIVARSVTIAGAVDGSIAASGRVRIMEGASVSAHVTAPSLLLVDGAQFSGTVDPELNESATHVARYRERNAGVAEAAKA
jgi:cytoskeletal protein CcmA (bactofilin family)